MTSQISYEPNQTAAESAREYDEIKMKILTKQIPQFALKAGGVVEADNWYKTKRGSLVKVTYLEEDGSVTVLSHFTGNGVLVPPEQVYLFTPAEDPGSPCGTMIVDSSDDGKSSNSDVSKYAHNYIKYPHIVPDSIYRVKSTGAAQQHPMMAKINTALQYSKGNEKVAAESVGLSLKEMRKIINKYSGKMIAKGQVRCLIKCQEPDCTNERDIKIQDVFQVKKCLECKNKKRKKNLDKFLKNKDKDTKKKTKKK